MAESKNELNKLLYQYQLANGINLVNFDNLEDVINNGFSANADVYSIINYLVNKYAGVPQKPYRKVITQKDGKTEVNYEEITDPKIVSLVEKANKNETLTQFKMLRYAFYLATGNSFVYAPKLQAGNMKGQLMDTGRLNMPSQYVEIISGGWREPIKGYIINYNYTAEHIPASDVVHVKMLNLKYTNGENFYGLSPIRVAALIIQAQNGGYEAMAGTLKRGFPSGILSKDGETDTDSGEALKRINVFKKIWQRFYSKSKNSGEPIITAGKVTWTPMGFSNFRDLQIIENSQHGLRVLCNVFQIPSIVMNDIQGTTFNNQEEVKKSVYTNRIIPDCYLFDEVDNVNIWSNYGFEVWSDYSGIPELQKNKKELIEVINIAQTAGALLTANEIRKAIEIDEVNEPIMNERFTSMGKTPASQSGDLNIDQALKNFGIEHYIK